MPDYNRARSYLLGLTGLRIDGGIASVGRTIARVLDEEIARNRVQRADRVLFLDDPTDTPPPPHRGHQWLARQSQLRFAARLYAGIYLRRPDVLLFDQIGLARTTLLPTPGLDPRPYVVFLHGVELDRAATGRLRRVLAGAWRLLTNSEFTAERVRRDFPEVADRVVPVPLCIDPNRVAAWERLEPELAGIAREPAALIVGRMWSEERGKGHDALLEAWPQVVRRVPEARLWVAGGGDDRPRLEARARELGVADHVEFLGRIPDDELARRMRRASVFVMPSRQEGFGLVYAEAMWHGLPPIGSSADAAREVIEDGTTGLLVPYGDAPAIADAVARVLGDPALRERLAGAGRERASTRFGYERFARDLLRALELDSG